LKKRGSPQIVQAFAKGLSRPDLARLAPMAELGANTERITACRDPGDGAFLD
jgi:hypothetical protein